ncbi:MAG: NAD-dependent epimerase/dehydratase family protein [Paludibaculum sp.]
MNSTDSIFVAGHRGLVGSAILRALQAAGHNNLVTATRQETDLCNQEAVRTLLPLS